MNSTRKMIILALLTSVGIVLGMIENGIPLPVKVPGAKLGLSNVIQLAVIVVIGFREGISVAVLKSFLIAVGTGNMSGLLYSLPSAIVSTVVMVLVYKFFKGKFSLIGVSIFGALAHNLVQLGVASALIGNVRVFTYYPVLAFISIFTGYFTGLTAIYFEKHLDTVYKKR
jgi:heptaprenyl diphosphate synthase